MRSFYGRTVYDVVGALITLLIALACFGIAEIAHAEPSEAVLQTIAMESANQSIEGQAWVAKVIQTRAEIGNISENSVVFKPKEFSCWNSRKLAQSWLDKHYTASVRLQAEKAYRIALYMKVKPTHYHTINTKPNWAVGHKPVAIVGNHKFYEGIK